MYYGNAFEIFEECVFDIDAWVQYARSLGYTEIVLQAHSFGPSKITYYISQKPAQDIHALIFISPVDMLGTTLAKNNHREMLLEAEDSVKKGTQKNLLSRRLGGQLYISGQTYISLFGEHSKTNIFCYTKREHDWSDIRNIKIPVLALGGTKDEPIECLAKTEDAFSILKKELVHSPRFGSKIYQGAAHSFKGFDKEILRDVLEFLKNS